MGPKVGQVLRGPVQLPHHQRVELGGWCLLGSRQGRRVNPALLSCVCPWEGRPGSRATPGPIPCQAGGWGSVWLPHQQQPWREMFPRPGQEHRPCPVIICMFTGG